MSECNVGVRMGARALIGRVGIERDFRVGLESGVEEGIGW